ncbi:MAG: ABC transporter permease, partial [Alphaproteobacteria bacterium]
MKRDRVELGFGLLLVCLLLVIALVPGLFARSPDEVEVSRRLLAPSSTFWFGTDETGRDVYARVLHGTRTTLGIVGAAIALAAIIGGVLGATAGFFGKISDLVLSRGADAMLAFPPIILGV